MCPSSTRTSATDRGVPGQRLSIRPALAADIDDCRKLFREYQDAIGVSLCFQGFDQELAALPGDYREPRGGLWLASVDGALAGCAALRPLANGDAEMKRLFVREGARGHSVGRLLAEHVIEAAREKGYRRLLLDTLPTMGTAQSLYEQLGFVDTAPYNDNPVAGVRFMALDLAKVRPSVP